MKNIIACLVIILHFGIAFAQNNLILNIEGAIKEGGKIYISLFDNEESYNQRNVYRSLVANSTSETASVQVALPFGEYLFSVYQDQNSNGELDTNLLGIPKEKFGFSNYDGKSAPGCFKKHKVLINEKTCKISIHLYKI